MTEQAKGNKTHLRPLQEALYDFDLAKLRGVLGTLMAPDALCHMCFPFGDVIGPEAFVATCFEPLAKAWPDLERRDWIVMAGTSESGGHWVGCGGHYMGRFLAPWLDIPPTGHLVHMRYHEFYRFEGGKIQEVQAIWDIPEVMMQAGAWPMAPSLGREFCIPAPAPQDGLSPRSHDDDHARASCAVVVEMLEHMKRHPAQGGPEVMELERFWHPKMNWYGPAGIGTGRGISGFRNWHQIPFLQAMPDRGQYVGDIEYHFFGEGDYVAVTGWPDMIQTLSHDGWMGIAPVNKRITMRSLDFWRLEQGKIRENWVLVDLLDMYDQIGVDVFGRLRMFNKSKSLASITFDEKG